MRFICCLFLSVAYVLAASGMRPNFVILLADDLGYGDVGCFGSEIVKTPNIDRLASEGLRLTSCYSAASNCSPARTGLMTGRTPYRVGVHSAIPFDSPMHMRNSEITIATLLRQNGYATCQVGKWHMNGQFNQSNQPQPSDHGFDYWFSTQNNALPNHKDPENFVRNGSAVGKLRGYSASLVANEAIEWLESKRDKTKPFFLYVAFHEPHEPISSDPIFSRQYPSQDPSYSSFYGNIAQMDDACGRVLEKLDRLDLRDDTFVFFTSDNGPAITAIHPHGSAGPLRGKKGDLYEGGIRVPGIIRWPGRISPGSQSDQPVCGVDLLPTLCEMTGIETPEDRAIDGTSVLRLLAGDEIHRTKPLYWQYNYARTQPKVAMRSGDLKILATLDTSIPSTPDITDERTNIMKTAGLNRFELYNLKTDIGETSDLSSSNQAEFEAMKSQLSSFYQEVQSETPQWPAWKHKRYEASRIVWPDYWLPGKKK